MPRREVIELVHQGAERITVGKAVVYRRPGGGLTMSIDLMPGYSDRVTRTRYRQLIEDYMGEMRSSRRRTYRDPYIWNGS